MNPDATAERPHDWRYCSRCGKPVALGERCECTPLDAAALQRSIDFDTPAPSVHGSDTSAEAADAIRPKAGTLRARVLEYVESRGLEGATDEEQQDALGMNPSTQRPRRVELVERFLLEDSGRKRPTRSGRRAVVWISAEVK